MDERFVRASELGEYAYCARAWWLAHIVGRERENLPQLAAGQRRHHRHGRQLSLAALLLQAGLVLIFTALFFALFSAILGRAP